MRMMNSISSFWGFEFKPRASIDWKCEFCVVFMIDMYLYTYIHGVLCSLWGLSSNVVLGLIDWLRSQSKKCPKVYSCKKDFRIFRGFRVCCATCPECQNWCAAATVQIYADIAPDGESSLRENCPASDCSSGRGVWDIHRVPLLLIRLKHNTPQLLLLNTILLLFYTWLQYKFNRHQCC